MKQSIGLHIQSPYRKDRLWRLLGDGEINNVFVSGNPGLLKDIIQEFRTVQYPILRYYSKSDAHFDTPDRWIKEIDKFIEDGFRDMGAYLAIMNEPVPCTDKETNETVVRRFVDTSLAIHDYASKKRVKLAMWGLGAAVVPRVAIQRGLFDRMLWRFLDDPNNLLFNIHTYFPFAPTIAAAGGIAEWALDFRRVQRNGYTDPKTGETFPGWPSPADINLSRDLGGSKDANFYVGKHNDWQDQALHIQREAGIQTNFKRIWFYAGECGTDHFGNIGHVYTAFQDGQKRKRNSVTGIPNGYRAMRGFMAHQWYFEDMFQVAGWSWQRAAFEYMDWQRFGCNDTIYNQNDKPYPERRPSIVGYAPFTWTAPGLGEKGDRWDDDWGCNIAHMDEWQDLVILNTAAIKPLPEAWVHDNQPPVEEPPIVIPPVDPDPPTPPTEPPPDVPELPPVEPPADTLDGLYQQLMSYNTNLATLADVEAEIHRKRARIHNAIADIHKQIGTLTKPVNEAPASQAA